MPARDRRGSTPGVLLRSSGRAEDTPPQSNARAARSAGAFVLTNEQVASLGEGKKSFPVAVTVNRNAYPLRLARMGGENLIGMSKAARTAAGVEIGSSYAVVVEFDGDERKIEVPDDLATPPESRPGGQRIRGTRALASRRVVRGRAKLAVTRALRSTPERTSLSGRRGQLASLRWRGTSSATVTSALPVIWDADFLYGPKNDAGEDPCVLCEINVSAVWPFPPHATQTLAAAAMRRIVSYQ
jgi:Domain of unknown function (DUF6815)/Domain of unknown function (DUF1905)